MLALMLGCGLRRGEVADLRIDHLQQREDHWVIADLVGKAAHIRTVPVPEWVTSAIDEWVASAAITEGRLFRCVSRKESVWGAGITEKVIWHVVKAAAATVGIAKLSPHDCRRYAESQTMPNRYKGSCFGGEFDEQSNRLIRHSLGGS
jgi:integrase